MKRLALALSKKPFLVPATVLVMAVAALAFWLFRGAEHPPDMRVPGTDHAPGSAGAAGGNAVLAGKLIRGDGQPANLPGAWPQFRGPARDGTSRESAALAGAWQAGQPRELWSLALG
ncbi:MAG TPA: hypothetical protein VN673_14180, partial [Clostridia bacterium]|nr:hypothetical protein [Clostridia bacterium]